MTASQLATSQPLMAALDPHDARAVVAARRRRRVYRPLSAEARAALSERMRCSWADGAFAGRRSPRHLRAWMPEQDRWLREHGGSLPLAELTAAFNASFLIDRSPASLRIRAKRIHVSLWTRGWSLRQVELLFGVDHRAIVRWWVEPGLLPATRWAGRGPHAGWWFDEHDLDRFIRDCGWAYDWRQVQVGSRLTLLAETVARSDPWRSYAELAAHVGISLTNLEGWRRRGVGPCRRRSGAGTFGQIMVRGRDFLAIKASIVEARPRARRGAA